MNIICTKWVACGKNSRSSSGLFSSHPLLLPHFLSSPQGITAKTKSSGSAMRATMEIYGSGSQLQPGLLSRHRSEEHTSELQSRGHLVCRLLLEKKKQKGQRAN